MPVIANVTTCPVGEDYIGRQSHGADGCQKAATPMPLTKSYDTWLTCFVCLCTPRLTPGGLSANGQRSSIAGVALPPALANTLSCLMEPYGGEIYIGTGFR